MANIKSQIKRIKTNLKAQDRNKAAKSGLKTVVRVARDAIASGDKANAVNAVAAASRKLDKAVSKGVIHKNQAANRKSSLAIKVAALDGDATVTKDPVKAVAKAPAKKAAVKASAKAAPAKASATPAAKSPTKAPAAKAPATSAKKKADDS